MEIVFATTNAGKLREIRSIFADLPEVSVVSSKDAGVSTEIAENGATYEQNALIKAVTAMRLTGKITLADDSGLEIDYLGKRPGIYSARFLGADTPYDIKQQQILEMLKDVPDDLRSARFVCAIAAAFPNGENYTTRGVMEGRISHEIRDNGFGFGYDPIFFLPAYNMTTGEMQPDEKNKISHRALALRQMLDYLKERLTR
jgi:XTP/dITP diphosphohydrolase